jgi:ligand-binding sensor domain-containing protein
VMKSGGCFMVCTKNSSLSTFSLVLTTFLIFSVPAFSLNLPAWDKSAGGIHEQDIRTLAVDLQSADVLYAGTSKALYRLDLAQKNADVLLQLQGNQKGINAIHVIADESRIIYAATDAGLYQGFDNGASWKLIYSDSNADSRRSLSVIQHHDAIYLGTQRGLFFRNIKETTWQPITGGLKGDTIYQIIGYDSFLYIATDRALFRLDPVTMDLTRIFLAGIGVHQWREGLLEKISESIPLRKPSLKFVTIENGKIFVASSKGIYVSSDKGDSWERLATDSVPLDQLTSLVVLAPDDLRLLAGTERGIFFYKDGEWERLYKGLESNVIRYLVKDQAGRVHAATERGIFTLNLSEEPQPATGAPTDTGNLPTKCADSQCLSGSSPPQSFNHEPVIRDVHTWAITYAEVNPEKIQTWRRLSARRAWFPSITLDVDNDNNQTVSDTMWGTSSSGGRHYVGPDDRTLYDNWGFGASMSWDLADIVWSSDQTSIDSRSKLMVELREDILDQVTRLYFERRRLQTELHATNEITQQEKSDKELRIAELTALIDAFTGGKFSNEIEECRSSLVTGDSRKSCSQKEQ